METTQLIRLLPLPDELNALIHSYLVEDKIIENTKRLKRIIYYKFTKSRHCRRDYDNVSWTVWLQNSKQVEKQFQAWHCKRCGDYIDAGQSIYTNKIKCKC